MCILVLVTCNRMGGLSLPMNSVVTLTDRPQISMDVEQQNSNNQAHFRKRQFSVEVQVCKSDNNVVSTTEL